MKHWICHPPSEIKVCIDGTQVRSDNVSPNSFDLRNRSPAFTVYSRIPAAQDVSAWTYNDTVIAATVNY